MTEPVHAILRERETTHGSFISNGKIAQGLKRELRNSQWWGCLDPCHKEALDMICAKISRILSGNAGYVDHWADIAGYAQLIITEIETHGKREDGQLFDHSTRPVEGATNPSSNPTGPRPRNLRRGSKRS